MSKSISLEVAARGGNLYAGVRSWVPTLATYALMWGRRPLGQPSWSAGPGVGRPSRTVSHHY